MKKLLSLSKKHKLLIHGLWPSRKDRKMLDDCNNGDPFEIIKTSSYPFSTMNEVWPSLKNNNYEEFWGHEYNKHGYCYSEKTNTEGYATYFSKVLDLYKTSKFEELVKTAIGVHPGKEVSFSMEELTQKFTSVLGSKFFEFDCIFSENVQYFNEMRIYYDLSFNRMNGFSYSSTCKAGQDITFRFEEADQTENYVKKEREGLAFLADE